jgi:hypothetical protein
VGKEFSDTDDTDGTVFSVATEDSMISVLSVYKWFYVLLKKCPGRPPGGTRSILLTVASFRTWRGSQVSAAPDPPGRAQGYPM